MTNDTRLTIDMTEKLATIIENRMNEYAQMLQQKHTRGDFNFLVNKTAHDVYKAIASEYSAESEK